MFKSEYSSFEFRKLGYLQSEARFLIFYSKKAFIRRLFNLFKHGLITKTNDRNT